MFSLYQKKEKIEGKDSGFLASADQQGLEYDCVD